MRINSIGKIGSVMKTYEVTRSKKSEKSYMKKDEVLISEFGKEYQIALKELKKLPDVREEKVSKIKESIENGSYKIDFDKLAESMILKTM